MLLTIFRGEIQYVRFRARLHTEVKEFNCFLNSGHSNITALKKSKIKSLYPLYILIAN